jgi:N-methylhydantoinase A
MAESEPIEIVNFIVAAIGAIAKPTMRGFEPGLEAPPDPVETRPVYFDAQSAAQVPVYRRAALASGMRLAGPAIIEEPTSTTVLYPGQSARIDEYLAIEMDVPPS